MRNQRPTYRGAVSAYTSLLPWQVRERRFKAAGLGRRGLEPADVYAFLDRVAGDMAAVYAALAASRRETAAITLALRRRQSDQDRARDDRGPAA
ncbi:DivIVA domain-containing protein [Micromonospora endolithica]|uniref:DivIVA domain-containing protein n=1 Tax=Micromonospora endolithica TaxID=230091 RepID=A0A3A9ZHH8_9ACTN|nr:DivIVA domain-containing protein [Micromonospora endolithica]RKN47720.1 DivIVA domain-containing protein [Micromonospora endolithica]TWJ21392.1 DivIVA domain-containing protein [Micromonospora endolithica]